MKKKRYIFVNGNRKVSVKEELYKTYMSFDWNDKKRKERHGEFSYDFMIANGYDCVNSTLVEDIVADKILLQELLKALESLTDAERSLIEAHYYNSQSLRRYAEEKSTNHTSIIRLHEKIVEKLRNLLTKYM